MNSPSRIVRRRFPLWGSGAGGGILPEAAGILSVTPVRGALFVTYDALLLDHAAVEQWLEQAGYQLRRDGWQRLRALWFAFSDENARRNLQAPEGGCCSRPAGIYHERKKLD